MSKATATPRTFELDECGDPVWDKEGSTPDEMLPPVKDIAGASCSPLSLQAAGDLLRSLALAVMELRRENDEMAEILEPFRDHLPQLQQDAALAAFYEAPLAARVYDLEQLALVGAARTAAALYAGAMIDPSYRPRTFAEELENIFEPPASSSSAATA